VAVRWPVSDPPVMANPRKVATRPRAVRWPSLYQPFNQ